MVKRNTWILLALFLALAGFAIYQKYTPQTNAPDETATPAATLPPLEFLFPEEGVVTSLLIESREGKIVGVERDGEGWVVTAPADREADSAAVEAAASQVTALTILSHLDLDPAAARLRQPAYTITVGFGNSKFLVAYIGDKTPSGQGYYARKDEGGVLVIDTYGMDALLGLITNPPFLPTPTPSPVPPTETPTPTPTAGTETPTATKSP